MGSSAAVRDKATAQILQSMFVLFLVMELIELIPIRIQDIYIYILAQTFVNPHRIV